MVNDIRNYTETRPGPYPSLFCLSDILERLLDVTNKYIINLINLMVLLVMLNRIPEILRDTKVAFLQQECRFQFQTRGVDDYYSNFPDVQIGLNKIASNIDLFYNALPFLFIDALSLIFMHNVKIPY